MAINQFIIDSEPAIRLFSFLLMLCIMGVLELFSPKRVLTQAKLMRWLNNIGLVFVNTIIVRLLFPTAVVGVALFSQSEGWGLLLYFSVPLWLAILLTIVLLDLTLYLQHVMFHALPIMWRFHRMHHADLDFDVTTGLRFHPGEIVVSLLIQSAAVLLLGPPIAGVVLFGVLLNATSLFNHSNIHMPKLIDKVVRWFIVTPDMHRVHHSDIMKELNSNFGFNLSVWDRILGTYRAQPSLGHQGMTIGLKDYRNPKQADRLLGMLWIPFIKDKRE